jgi:hypothetical protein
MRKGQQLLRQIEPAFVLPILLVDPLLVNILSSIMNLQSKRLFLTKDGEPSWLLQPGTNPYPTGLKFLQRQPTTPVRSTLSTKYR